MPWPGSRRRRPEFRDLTLYYFGDTDPAHYGVVGRRYVIDASDRHPDLPPALAADTEYLAVSASLQWGPWGPPGYFRRLDPLPPVATLEDYTITIYRTADLRAGSPATTSSRGSRPPDRGGPVKRPLDLRPQGPDQLHG